MNRRNFLLKVGFIGAISTIGKSLFSNNEPEKGTLDVSEYAMQQVKNSNPPRYAIFVSGKHFYTTEELSVDFYNKTTMK